MKTTHTPGPWYPERPYGEDGVYVACAATSALVCKLNKVDGRFYQDAQESIYANARLIASAPELLAALESLVSELAERTHKDGRMMSASFVRGEVCSVKALESARAAIAKAKGQE